MVGRASGSSISIQARQLLKSNAKNTKDTGTKIQILAVKMAKIELETSKGPRLSYSEIDRKMQAKDYKMERLTKSLQSYVGLNKREATLVAKSLVSDYKTILEHGDAIRDPMSSIGTPSDAKMTALRFGLNKAGHAKDAGRSAFSMVKDRASLNAVLAEVKSSAWSRNQVIYDTMMEEAMLMLDSGESLHPAFKASLEQFCAPLKERQAMTKYSEVLVSDLLNGHITVGQMRDAVDASPPEIKNFVMKELHKQATIALTNRDGQQHKFIVSVVKYMK